MTNTKKNEIDMLQGPIAGNLIKIALPLAAISILQQFFNAADVAVVGKFASADAIAAVGANTPIINMFLTFFTGLTTGGNVAIASLIGRGEKERVSDAVHTVFTLSLISALIVIVVGQIIARPILILISTPDNILDSAVLYLRIYLFAMMFAVIYNFASAILRSKGDTKRPLYCLITSGVLNVILNLVFVIGFKLDVAGVAIATLISNILCAGITVVILLKEQDSFRLDLRKLRLSKDPLLFTLKIGVPAGIQGMLFSVSNIIIQSAINSFGSDCIAGNTAAMNFEFISYFVVNAFGQAATTYSSQNFSAGKYRRCDQVLGLSMLLGSGLSLLTSCIFYFGHSFWLGLFSSDPEVLDYAMVRMLYVVLLEFITAFNEMASSGLRAMEVSLPPAIVSICGSCILRIIWVNTIFRSSHTIQTLMLVYPVSWVFLALAMCTLFFFVRRKKYRQA